MRGRVRGAGPHRQALRVPRRQKAIHPRRDVVFHECRASPHASPVFVPKASPWTTEAMFLIMLGGVVRALVAPEVGRGAS